MRRAPISQGVQVVFFLVDEVYESLPGAFDDLKVAVSSACKGQAKAAFMLRNYRNKTESHICEIKWQRVGLGRRITCVR